MKIVLSILGVVIFAIIFFGIGAILVKNGKAEEGTTLRWGLMGAHDSRSPVLPENLHLDNQHDYVNRG